MRPLKNLSNTCARSSAPIPVPASSTFTMKSAAVHSTRIATAPPAYLVALSRRFAITRSKRRRSTTMYGFLTLTPSSIGGTSIPKRLDADLAA